MISGTVYVAIPPGASALKLEDPRLPLMMAAPPRRADAAEDRQPFVYLQPAAGTVLMWESWLRHEVPANAARPERIIHQLQLRLALTPRAGALTLVFLVAQEGVFLAVIAHDREAEARPAHLDVRPAADAARGQEGRHALVLVDQAPGPRRGLLGDEIALAGVAVAVGPRAGDDDVGSAVAIEVLHPVGLDGILALRPALAVHPLAGLDTRRLEGPGPVGRGDLGQRPTRGDHHRDHDPDPQMTRHVSPQILPGERLTRLFDCCHGRGFEEFAEEVTLVPDRPLVGFGQFSGDLVVQPGELGAHRIVDWLGEVVAGLVVVVAQEAGEGRPAAILEPRHQEDRGHAALHEAEMVAAGEQALVRQRVGRQLHPHPRPGPPHRRPQARTLGSERYHVGEIVGQDRHVQIDIGHDRQGRGGVEREVFRADQALFLRRVQQQQQGAPRGLALDEGAGDLQGRGRPAPLSRAPLLMASPPTGLEETPMWSRWAESTTTSFRSTGSEPAIRPTTLTLSSVFSSVFVASTRTAGRSAARRRSRRRHRSARGSWAPGEQLGRALDADPGELGRGPGRGEGLARGLAPAHAPGFPLPGRVGEGLARLVAGRIDADEAHGAVLFGLQPLGAAVGVVGALLRLEGPGCARDATTIFPFTSRPA